MIDRKLCEQVIMMRHNPKYIAHDTYYSLGHFERHSDAEQAAKDARNFGYYSRIVQDYGNLVVIRPKPNRKSIGNWGLPKLDVVPTRIKKKVKRIKQNLSAVHNVMWETLKYEPADLGTFGSHGPEHGYILVTAKPSIERAKKVKDSLEAHKMVMATIIPKENCYEVWAKPSVSGKIYIGPLHSKQFGRYVRMEQYGKDGEVF